MEHYLSIIIPARNEEKRIRTVEEFVKYFEHKYGRLFEILVVTDTCTDNTLRILSSLCKKYPQIKNYNYNYRLNKGGGIAKGFEKADGKIITYTDVDGSTKPRQLDNLIDILNIIDCDGIIASRYSGGSRLLVKQSLSRRLLSRGFNLLVKMMFGLPFSDTQCGAKVFKKKVAKNIAKHLSVTDWAFDVNLLYNAHKRKYDIREIPIVWEDKKGSRLNIKKVMFTMLFSLIRLRIVNSRFKKLVYNRLTNWVVRNSGLWKNGGRK